MNGTCKRGFTLVELIIVIIILGILAALAIPQFIDSTGDAQDATVKANLSALRTTFDLYFVQHDSIYPGEMLSTDGTTVNAADAARGTSLIAQLTQYSDRTGKVSATLDRANFPYGPYIRTGIPANPLSTKGNTVLATDDLGALTADGTTAWICSTKTGKLISNMTTGASASW